MVDNATWVAADLIIKQSDTSTTTSQDFNFQYACCSSSFLFQSATMVGAMAGPLCSESSKLLTKMSEHWESPPQEEATLKPLHIASNKSKKKSIKHYSTWKVWLRTVGSMQVWHDKNIYVGRMAMNKAQSIALY